MRCAQFLQQSAVFRAPLGRRTLAKTRNGVARQNLNPGRADARHRDFQIRAGDLNSRARTESHQAPELRVIAQTVQTQREGEKTILFAWTIAFRGLPRVSVHQPR